MYNHMRNQWEIKVGKKKAENQSTQLKTGIKLMNDDEIIQKIRESQNFVKSPSKQIIKKKPWIEIIYDHPGQYVFFIKKFIYFFIIYLEGISYRKKICLVLLYEFSRGFNWLSKENN
jgi:hypothetical protein